MPGAGRGRLPRVGHTYDIAVIGGGINGAGIARDAAGRGLSRAAVRAGRPGGATSSASTKLIHGGLRYLEHYEFRLVREALQEREVLLAHRAAHHLAAALRAAASPAQRPAWLLRLGLFLYDHLGGRQPLPRTRAWTCAARRGAALQPGFTQRLRVFRLLGGGRRLVVLNALDAPRAARHPHPHPLHPAPARGRALAATLQDRAPATRDGHARAPWSTPPGPGWRTCCAGAPG